MSPDLGVAWRRQHHIVKCSAAEPVYKQTRTDRHSCVHKDTAPDRPIMEATRSREGRAKLRRRVKLSKGEVRAEGPCDAVPICGIAIPEGEAALYFHRAYTAVDCDRIAVDLVKGSARRRCPWNADAPEDAQPRRAAHDGCISKTNPHLDRKIYPGLELAGTLRCKTGREISQPEIEPRERALYAAPQAPFSGRKIKSGTCFRGCIRAVGHRHILEADPGQ